MNWYLKKEFYDATAGIEAVTIHYTWTPAGQAPDWSAQTESRSMPAGEILRSGVGEVAKYGPPAPHTPQQVHPRLRKKVLRLPRTIFDPRIGGFTPHYALHWFHEIRIGGYRQFTPVVTEEIRTREVVLVDPLGHLGGACTNWSVTDWDALRFSPMEDPQFSARFGADHPLRQHKFYGVTDQVSFGVAKKAALDLLPLPHAFRATVSAPISATVRLRFRAGDWGQVESRRWETYFLTNESFVMTDGAPPLVYAPFGTLPAPAPVIRVTPELLWGNPYALTVPGLEHLAFPPFAAPAIAPFAVPAAWPVAAYYPLVA